MTSHISDLFIRDCAYMERLSRDMPSVRLVMQGLAMAEKTERIIPPAAQRYFEGFEENRKQLRDVPMSTVGGDDPSGPTLRKGSLRACWRRGR